jgi:hypothetical protein
MFGFTRTEVTEAKIKGDVAPHEDIWTSGGTDPSFLTLVLDGGEQSLSSPAALSSRKEPPVLVG